jgi:hypothetical protein
VVCKEAWHAGQWLLCIDKTEDRPVSGTEALVAELVDALVSGTSGESRGGSSPLLGTMTLLFIIEKQSISIMVWGAVPYSVPHIGEQKSEIRGKRQPTVGCAAAS